MTVKEPAPLSAALSEVIDAMTRFFGSTTEIDKLHAKALEDLTGLVRNLHDRALALEARVAALEKLAIRTPGLTVYGPVKE